MGGIYGVCLVLFIGLFSFTFGQRVQERPIFFPQDYDSFEAAIKADFDREISSTTTEKSKFEFPSFASVVSVSSSSSEKEPEEESLIPNNIWVPSGLNFTCRGRSPGYYSDPHPKSKCQAYHLCMENGLKYTMLCGIGTVFNQKTFVCDHWYGYNCANAEADYRLNDELWEHFLLPKNPRRRRNQNFNKRRIVQQYEDDE